MRQNLLALAFAVIPQIALAQVGGISSINIRPDGNTEQTTTIPNPDGSGGTQTTITITQPDGSSVQLDKQGHITNVSLKENCSEGTAGRNTNATYVCRLYKGELMQFKVLYLLYSCHAPDSNIYDVQRRFAISFQNTGVRCSETAYAVDRADAARYGETLPDYKSKTAETPKEPEKRTTGSGEHNSKRPRKAERTSNTKSLHAIVLRDGGSSETTALALRTGIDLALRFGSGRAGGDRGGDREFVGHDLIGHDLMGHGARKD
jgi:hypothetical protein